MSTGDLSMMLSGDRSVVIDSAAASSQDEDDEDEDETELLINLVREHPFIYKLDHPLHSNQQATRLFWMQMKKDLQTKKTGMFHRGQQRSKRRTRDGQQKRWTVNLRTVLMLRCFEVFMFDFTFIVDGLRARWRYLKSTFTSKHTEYKKPKPTGVSAASVRVKPWKWYSRMLFLSETAEVQGKK